MECIMNIEPHYNLKLLDTDDEQIVGFVIDHDKLAWFLTIFHAGLLSRKSRSRVSIEGRGGELAIDLTECNENDINQIRLNAPEPYRSCQN